MSRSLALASLLVAATASAHLMPARQGTLNVIDTGVFVAVSLPTAAFEGLGAAERDEELKRRFRVIDGTHAGRVDFLQVDPSHGDELVALMKVSFDAPPGALRVETDLVREELTLKFLRGAQLETVVLREARQQAFAPVLVGVAVAAAVLLLGKRRRARLVRGANHHGVLTAPPRRTA